MGLENTQDNLMYEELIEGCIIKAKSNELFSFSN
jgi:hypothetical protein